MHDIIKAVFIAIGCILTIVAFFGLVYWASRVQMIAWRDVITEAVRKFINEDLEQYLLNQKQKYDYEEKK